jgi:hypothetical protein
LGRNIDQTSINKNGAKIEVRFGIFFLSFFANVWSVLEAKRRRTPNEKHIEKSIRQKSTKKAQEAQQGSMVGIDPSHFGRRGGPPP